MLSNLRERYVIAMGDLELTPHLLSGRRNTSLGPAYPTHSKLAVLGESDALNQAQKVCLLIASEDGSAVLHDDLVQDVFAIGQVAQQLGHDIEASYARLALIEEVYQKNSDEIGRISRESQLQTSFLDLLSDALARRASDIHIEVRRKDATVRFRVDGDLIPVDSYSWSKAFASKLCSVIYSVVAEEQEVTFKPDQPQDAVVDKIVNGERLRVRLATIPAAPDGFDMVMRLQPFGHGESQKVIFLGDLGYSDEHVRLITAGMSRPVGGIVFAGTTGSGKSTSLKNILLIEIAQSEGTVKIITVENPPEFFIAGATQVPVSKSKRTSDGTSSFEAAITAAMRSDPDILMIGEVRDKTSADLLVGAVQSGHKAYTTVHAASANSIVGRLNSLGIARDILGSSDFISTLVYQSLLPVLCQRCKVLLSKAIEDAERYNLDAELLSRINHVSTVNAQVHVRGKGCAHCNNGIKGRTIVAEVIFPDHQMRRFFASGDSISAEEYWLKQGGKPILQHGISKMLSGMVSPHDVESSLGYLTSALVMRSGSIGLPIESNLPSSLDGSREEPATGLCEEVSEDDQNIRELTSWVDDIDDD